MTGCLKTSSMLANALVATASLEWMSSTGGRASLFVTR
jgi:hypothetical protein